MKKAFVLALLTVAGCDTNWWDPTRYSTLESQAPVFVLNDPGSADFDAARFGSVVVGYDTIRPDRSVVIPGGGSPNLLASRFIVGGGVTSPYFVYRGFEDRALSDVATTGMAPRLSADIVLSGCRDRRDCGEGAAPAIAAFDYLPAGLGMPGYGCTAANSGVVAGTERLNIRCESVGDTLLPTAIPQGVDFGASAAGIPAIRGDGCNIQPHPIGGALFGAPRADFQAGSLYRLAGVETFEVDLPGLALPANSSLGATLAAEVLDEHRVLVAIGARTEEGLAPPRVVVATLTEAAGVITAEVHACLGGAGVAPGFGRALAVGDLDGDASPEIVVGAGLRAEGTAGDAETPIVLYRYADLSGLRAVGCDGSDGPAPAHSIECDDVEDLVCAEPAFPERRPTGFGSALAIGDVDGTGSADLVIGAPYAFVNGIQSGGVVTLAGGDDLASLGVGQGHHAVIAPSNARTGMLLGWAVDTFAGADRDEIVAGAPGVGTAAALLCSGLSGDRPEDFTDLSGVTFGCVVPASPGRPPRCGGGSDAGMDAGVPSDAPTDDAPVDAGDDAPDPAIDAP